MSKRFKFKLSFSSFRLCRRKSTPATPLFFSPYNPKTLEISYPTFPSPPPTTPAHPPHLSKSKITPLPTTPQTYNNSPVSFKDCRNSGDRKTVKENGKTEKTNMASFHDSGWFSNSEEETESLVTGSRRESFDSFNETTTFCVKNGGGAAVDETTTFCVKNGGGGGKERRGVMKESVAVVKKSEEPYEDFKRSMLEMILEKQMFETKDLEQLLQCFLCLNSRHHHGNIVAAFTEIWELLFV